MKLLVTRGGIFLAIGLMLLHGLALIVQRVSPDGTAYLLRVDQRNIDTVLANAATVEAIAVGNSHGDDVDFAATSYRGYQLSRAWGDVFEVQYYLRYFVPKLPRLQAVFVPVSYFTFTLENSSVDRLSIRRRQLYRALPAPRFIPGDQWLFAEARLQWAFPVSTILREDNWKGIFEALMANSRPPDAVGPVARGCNAVDADAIDRHARGRVLEQVEFSAIVAARKRDIEGRTYSALAETVRWLEGEGIRVVLFTPPYPAAYTTAYQSAKPQAIVVAKANARKLAKEYGAEYFDYSLDRQFTQDPALFADGDHLNSCGKRLFSTELNKSLHKADQTAAR